MASCPITSGQIDGEKVETVTDFLFLGSKITADGDCSHEKMFLGRKATKNLDSVLKTSKGLYSKAMVFPVAMYKCESWTTNKAEH